MHDGTNGNERDKSDQWVESLLTNAGASVGRVLDDRQRRAVCLAVEVFAYLLAALPSEKVLVTDVIRLLKWYSEGVRHAEGSS
jgi:hypothetical protein